MRVMKDSGIEWIGQIPQDWSLERLKFHAELNPVTDISELTDEDDVSFIPMDHLKSGFHHQSMVPYQKVKKGYVTFADGDVLMAKVTPCLENGNLAIAEHLRNGIGFGSTEINVIRCHSVLNRYLFYLLQCPTYIKKATFNMFGVAGLKRLEPGFIPNSFFPIPSKEEQLNIIKYLDAKCAEIDALIAAKEKTNTLLKERRQSIIYEAVTKGLNPDAPMKDSGIEWIGEIPENWGIVALKRMATPSTGMTPSKANPQYWEGDIPWFSSKDIKADYLIDSEDHISQQAVDECGLTVHDENSVVFCARSGILRHTFPVAVLKCKGTINQDLRVLATSEAIDPEYLMYYLRGMNNTIVTLYQKVGATVESIEIEWLLYLPVALPPVGEQKEIAEHIVARCNEIDSQITANEVSVQKLKEYRQSIIYEAVTGKIEV